MRVDKKTDITKGIITERILFHLIAIFKKRNCIKQEYIEYLENLKTVLETGDEKFFMDASERLTKISIEISLVRDVSMFVEIIQMIVTRLLLEVCYIQQEQEAE
ncbi:hypothetical protein D4R87_00195 [bacterium]|nr:MAG: hypothetical protein D4R87_00195 [bacterium]